MTTTPPRQSDAATVLLMCGLPASGKTTTAMRLHARLGGVLIRSCDVYQELGIVLPEWVKRTARFTTQVDAYDRVREEAYVEMARRAAMRLASGTARVIVDAVHGERPKRQRLYEICARHQAIPILVQCLCADLAEVRRRFRAREGHEHDPEHEASDLSVFYDIERRWEDPFADAIPGGGRPAIVVYDTLNGIVARGADVDTPVLALIQAALTESRSPHAADV